MSGTTTTEGAGVRTSRAAARQVAAHPPRARLFRVFRRALVASVVAIVAAHLWDSFARVRSIQGFINAEIISVNAPIAGDLALEPLDPGTPVALGAPIGRIVNPRASLLEIRHQEAATRLAVSKRLLESLERGLAERRRIMRFVSEQAQLARGLELEQARLRQERLDAEVESARWTARLAKMRADRSVALRAASMISAEEADLLVAEAQRAAAVVRAAEAERAQTEREADATAAGLQGFSHAQKRALELETETLDLEERVANAAVEVEAAAAELARAAAQLERERGADVRAPAGGVVWSIEARAGEHVSASAPILRLVNSRRTWVDAFVAEQDAGQIRPGDAVEVRLLGPAFRAVLHRWRGRVESVRANTGRVSPGYEVAIPPPENARRLVAVRVAVDWGGDTVLRPEQFLGVGRSVEVIFERGKGPRP